MHYTITFIIFDPSPVPPERVVVDKERSSGTYRLSAYYLAKMFSELPLLIIFPTLHITVWYWMGGLNGFVGAFFVQWVILISNALVGQVRFIH